MSLSSLTFFWLSSLQSGKDLVQEVAKLRRSLDDAEGVSRDTKKEWAVLRSQNMALEERNVSGVRFRWDKYHYALFLLQSCGVFQVTMTADHDKMGAEVNSLRFQLETERSRYRKMQSDLQKELNVAFDENTKLTSLLDGKVPKSRFSLCLHNVTVLTRLCVWSVCTALT